MKALQSPDKIQMRAAWRGCLSSSFRFELLLLSCGLCVGGLATSCSHFVSPINDVSYASSIATQAMDAGRTQQVLNANATLQDYLRYAALHNVGLEAAFNRWRAALERIPQAKSPPDPRLNYTYYVEKADPQRHLFGLSQEFPWLGKLRLQGDAAAAEAEARRQEFQKAKLDLFRRVKTAYCEYWYQTQALTVTREHLQLVANLEKVARTRFKTGVSPNSAVIQAEVELAKLDDRLRTLEAQSDPLVAKLNATLHRPMKLALPRPRVLPEIKNDFTDEQALQWLADRNPDLQRLDRLIERDEVGVALAKKNYYPDITLGVEYVDTDAALSDHDKDPVMAMVSVNVPLWYKKYRAAEREARLSKMALETERVDMAKLLEADLRLSLYQFRDAERKIDLYRHTLLPKAAQSLKVVQQEFETGRTEFIALIDAQRLLLEFQLELQRALADSLLKLAEIELLTGSVVLDDG